MHVTTEPDPPEKSRGRTRSPSSRKQNKDLHRRDFLLSALEQYERPLTAYAMRLVGGDSHAARDAVQHSFMQLCKQPVETVKPKLAPWLYTVCRNQILDEFKSGFRRGSAPENFDTVDAKAIDPANQFELEDFSNAIVGLFDCLHESEREVIELWSHGFDASEIGDILKKKPGTVRVNLHRAIKRLRQHPEISKWLERATGQIVRPDDEAPPKVMSSKVNGNSTPSILGEKS